MIQSRSDIEAAARTLWGEARGEPVGGQQAVAWVMRNRAEIAEAYVERHNRAHPLFGHGDLTSVVMTPWQFSCRNPNDPNRLKMFRLTPDEITPFIDIVDFVMCASTATDPTSGATHYVNPAVAHPDWISKATLTAAIGHHKFYKDVP